jgi:hypothetical protein
MLGSRNRRHEKWRCPYPTFLLRALGAGDFNLLFFGLIAVLRTPWCSEAWPYSKRDDPQVTDSCEAHVATQDESPAATFVMEDLMVIRLRVRCSSPSGT